MYVFRAGHSQFRWAGIVQTLASVSYALLGFN